MSKARGVLADSLKIAFRPKQKLTPDLWCEKNIRLPAKASPSMPGKFSLATTPYLRQIYCDVGNPRVEKIAVMKAAQVGASLFISNLIQYYVANHSLPFAVFLPSEGKAREFCEEKLHPTLEDSEAIKPFLTGKGHDIRKTNLEFTSCIVRVIGAGNSSKLAGSSYAVVCFDECDKSSDFSTAGETSAILLAEKRALSFSLGDKKIILLSTPTNTEESQIYEAFLAGSQSKYFCPCPKCNHEQELTFEGKRVGDSADGATYEGGVVFRDAKRADGSYDFKLLESVVYYECAACKAHLREKDRVHMVRNGRWIDTNPDAPQGFRSYHISRLMSLQPGTTLATLALEWLQKRKSMSGAHDFKNSVMGWPWEERAQTFNFNDIDNLVKASPFAKRGTLLDKPDSLILSVDTQGASFWYSFVALYRNDAIHIVDWGQVAGWKDLLKLVNQKFPIVGSSEYYGVNQAIIDSGYKTTQVYDLVIQTAKRFLPVKGMGTAKSSTPTEENPIPYKGINIPLLLINDYQFTWHLLINCIKQRGNQKLILPSNIDFILKEHLTCTYLAEKKDESGKIISYFKNRDKENHLLDTIKYAMGLFTHISPIIAKRRANEELITEPPDAAPSVQLDSVGWG